MTFHRLKETDRGSIILVNLHETVTAGLIDDDLLKTSMKTIGAGLAALPSAYEDTDLLRVLSGAILSRAAVNQIAGNQTPDPGMVVVGVRPFEDVAPVLSKLRRQSEGHLSVLLDNALAADATEGAMADAAGVINTMTHEFDFLTLGWKYGVFWGTHLAHFERIEAAHYASGKRPEDLAATVRDCLGLVQYGPDNDGKAQHLFAFVARTPNREVTQKFKARRPTTLDGFDNHRFRQHLPVVPQPVAGCGFTVDLSPAAYGIGAPECVSTEIPLKNFTCRYLGSVGTPAWGTDAEFLHYLSPPKGFDDMASDLDLHAA